MKKWMILLLCFVTLFSVGCTNQEETSLVEDGAFLFVYDNMVFPLGDVFLKDTYDTGTPGGISHVGIYMGTLTIKGETAEWVIDTGGNPEGVKISKYNNGWWNGSNFYGFGRLK